MATIQYAGKANESGPYSSQRELAHVKYDFKTVQSQLSESCLDLGNVGFVWGNPQSSHEIACYVSVACSHCDKTIKELRRITDIYPDLYNRLIFAVNSDNLDDQSNSIIRQFINLYQTMSKNEFFDMLHVWYSTLNRNLEALQKAYPATPYPGNGAEIDALYRFGKQAKIGHTPAILLNGKLLSQLYSYTDLYGLARTLFAEE